MSPEDPTALPSPHLPSLPLPQNVAANHRINDAVANEDGPQVVTGRFMYGPLDMVTLTGEKVRMGMARVWGLRPGCGRFVTSLPGLQVDVHIMTQPPSGEWLYLDTLVTNSSGRVSYTIPETHRLGVGVYPIKMVVRYVPLVGEQWAGLLGIGRVGRDGVDGCAGWF